MSCKQQIFFAVFRLKRALVDMGIPAAVDDVVTRYRLRGVFLSVFLFCQPFKHAVSVRDGAFVALLVLFVLRAAAGRVKLDFRDRTLQALSALVAVAVVSAAISPYVLDSFDAIRKNLFYQVVVFLFIVSEYGTFEELRPVFYSVLLGFAVLSLLIVAKIDTHALLDWLAQKGENTDLLGGYSLYATFYIPFAIGYLYSSNEKMPVKAALVVILFLEFALSLLNNHRGQIVAILVSAALVTILRGRYKALIAGAVICVVISGAVLYGNPRAFDRYETLLTPANYASDDPKGLNERRVIWSGAVDMIRDRPLLGWGYGWKKFGLVPRDAGYLDRWDRKDSAIKYFMGKGDGRANPHNLVLQILFEVGFIGFVAFVIFWSTVAAKAADAFTKKDTSVKGGAVSAAWLKYCTVGVLVSYVLINMVNGLWEESYGVLMMSFAAFCVVLHREAFKRDDTDAA